MTITLDAPAFRATTDRLHAAAAAQRTSFLPLAFRLAWDGLTGRKSSTAEMTESAKNLFLPISRDQGRFMYGVARAVGARRVVEFGTSFGISTLYLAAAVRDNGGGIVIGSELDPGKVAAARGHLAEAGLSEVSEVREGDALQTLADPGGPVDMVLLDGWKDLYLPVLKLLHPHLRPGAVVLGDNIHTFKKAMRPFVEYVQSGQNGYTSLTLPLADGFEFAVKVGD